jgi:quercetin dioxygenase-like cupin family protein
MTGAIVLAKEPMNKLHKRPDEGTEFRFGSNKLLVKVGELSGANLANMFVSEFPPGAGNPFLHLHNSYEEMFYILQGEIEYRLGTGSVRASAGDSIFVPRGTPRKFVNVGKTQAVHLVVVAPCAAMRMIEELAHTGLDRTAQAQVYERYDSVLLAE